MKYKIKTYSVIAFLLGTKSSIKRKLALFYIGIIIIFVLAFQVTNHYFSYKALESQAIRYAGLILKNINSEVDRTIYELDKLSRLALSDPKLLNILKEDQLSGEEENYLLTFIENLVNFRTDIQKVYITNFKKINIVSGVNRYVPETYKMEEESWYNDFIKSKDVYRIIPPYYSDVDSVVLFSVIRKIRTSFIEEPVGLIKIDVTEGTLNEIFSRSELSKEHLLIFSESSDLIFDIGGQNYEYEVGNVVSKIKADRGYYYFKTNKDKYILNYNKSQYTNWVTSIIISENTLLKEIRFNKFVSYISIILFSLLVLVSGIGITSSISNGINKLLIGMNRLELGDFDVRVVVNTKDELTVLSKGFNEMASKMQNLIKANTEIWLKKREAEMKVLQNQINPHFLYNTLDTIRMKAFINKNDEAAKMIEEFSNMLRYTSKNGSEFITLAQEIDYVDKYIQLQNKIYKQKILLVKDIDPSLMEARVPKFIIQPLIENSIFHGLESLKINRKINISAIRLSEKWIIGVEDNGIGITDSKLETIREELNNYEDSFSQNIGLKNIHSRLRLYYGNDYGISINSIKNRYTKVTLNLGFKHIGGV